MKQKQNKNNILTETEIKVGYLIGLGIFVIGWIMWFVSPQGFGFYKLLSLASILFGGYLLWKTK